MKTLSHQDVILLLLQIGVMLLVGKVLGELVKKLKQPVVIGEILAGILLGPTVLGNLFPEFSQFLFPAQSDTGFALNGLTSISVVLLLLVAGLEVELSTILGQRNRAMLTSLTGISFSFLLGFSTPYLFSEFFTIPSNNTFVFALFLGTALSITALPVIARTLMDLGIFKTQIGMLIIASAMIDDFFGWMIFSVVLGLIKQGDNLFSLFFTIAGTIFFAGFMLSIGKKIIDKSLPLINKHLSFPGGILAFVITLALFAAAFTEFIGIHAIFGSFIVGVALSGSMHMSLKTKEIIHDFVANIFAPLFFVSIGLKINFINNFDLTLVLLILFLAFIGKITGCSVGSFLGTLKLTKKLRLKNSRKNLWNDLQSSLAVGFGMNARGAMEIILASLALEFGVIDETMFVALVVMALLTSIVSGYMMKMFLPKELKNYQTNGIIIFGNNTFSQFIAKYLRNVEKIPVLLLADTNTKNGTDKIITKQEKITTKQEIATYPINMQDKHVFEKLDLSRYSTLLALSENEAYNKRICNLFEYEFTGSKTFRLITKNEANLAGAGEELEDIRYILFRDAYWFYQNIANVMQESSVQIFTSNFEDKDQLNRFLRFNIKFRAIIPLFIRRKDATLEPVTKTSLEIENGDVLIYLEIKTPPKSRKPKSLVQNTLK